MINDKMKKKENNAAMREDRKLSRENGCLG